MSGFRRVIFTSAAVFSALASAQSTGIGKCTDLHIFLSRGNNEPYPGRQGKLVDAICSGLDSCDYEDIDFDNALSVEYCSAVEAGRVAGIKQITAYAQKCPKSKLVVSGYSQGAQVVGDILGGGGGTFFQNCFIASGGGLDPNSSPGKNIAAALLFGDTRHTADQSYNVLEGAGISGLFPRSGGQLAGLNEFSGVLRSYCQFDDPICAAGDGHRTDTVVADHLNYFDKYPQAAADWVHQMVGMTPDTTSTTTSTPTPTPTSSTTSEASSSSTVIVTTASSSTPTSSESTSGVDSTSSTSLTLSTLLTTITSAASSTNPLTNPPTDSPTNSPTIPITTPLTNPYINSSTTASTTVSILPEATAPTTNPMPTATAGAEPIARGVTSLMTLFGLGSLIMLV